MRKFLILYILIAIHNVNILGQSSEEGISYIDSVNDAMYENDYTEAKRLALLGLQTAIFDNDLFLEAHFYHHLSFIGEYEGDFESMLYYAWVQEETARETGDSNLIAIALKGQGEVNTIVGNYDIAIDYLTESHRLFEKLENEEQVALSNNSLAIYYSSNGNFEKASELYLKAAAQFKISGETVNEALSLSNAGYNFIELKQYDNAEKFLNQSLKLVLTGTNKHEINRSKSTLLHFYIVTDNQPLAKKYYDEIESTEEWLSANLSETIYSEFSLYHETFGSKKTAIEYLNKSIKIAKESQDNVMLLEFLERRAKLYKKSDMFKLAIEDYEVVQLLKDSVLTQEKHEEVLKINAIHNLEEKKQETELENVASDEDSSSEDSASTEFYIIWFLIALLIIITAGLVIIIKKMKAKIASQKSELLELKKLASD